MFTPLKKVFILVSYSAFVPKLNLNVEVTKFILEFECALCVMHVHTSALSSIKPLDILLLYNLKRKQLIFFN